MRRYARRVADEHRAIAPARRRAFVVGVVAAVGALLVAACGGATGAPSEALDAPSTASSTVASTQPPTTTAAPATTLPPTTSTSSTTSTSTTTSTTTTSTTTTIPAPTTTLEPLPDPALPATNAAFDALASGNRAAQMTVARDGAVVFAAASGTTIGGDPATSDTPMVVASVSKLITAYSIARLHQNGSLDVDRPLPWADLGIAVHPTWNEVTLREMLAHTSGMPKVRTSWFGGSGDCASYLPRLVDDPPLGHRGTWVYSNGNYCALGLLVAHLTGEPIDAAAQQLLFDPLDADGVHVTVDGQLPGDVGYSLGVDRLARLGGAGTFIVSTDDLVAMTAATTLDDASVLVWPGVFADQYGWGHTGTIDGAKSCVWVMEGWRTVVAATVAGNSPGTGGALCDRVVLALARDLGIADGVPDRSPP